MSGHRDPRVARVTRAVMDALRAEVTPGAGASGEGGRSSVAPAPRPGPITAMIDHTLLRPEATRDDILRLADEARAHGFAAVCVNPTWVSLAARRLAGTGVKVATVVGFPLGAVHSEIKALEARRAHEMGAHEIDMVINQGELRGGRLEAVMRDVACVRRALGAGVTLKAILETGRLDADATHAAARAAVDGGADYLKTSTGFGAGGATVEAVRILRKVAGERLGVKASGGIRSLSDARAMVAAGASRIGASSGVAIAAEEAGRAAPSRTPRGHASPPNAY